MRDVLRDACCAMRAARCNASRGAASRDVRLAAPCEGSAAAAVGGAAAAAARR